MAKLSDIVYDPPGKNCKDCLSEFGFCQRPAPYSGPRCRTHMLAKRNTDRRTKHRSSVETKYNLPPGGYDALKEYQGGACGICQKGKGITKNLAVDHNHKHCDECAGSGSCGKGVRGLLCGRCNSLLAHIRDDLATARRIFHYLEDPPYQRMIRAQGKDPMQRAYDEIEAAFQQIRVKEHFAIEYPGPSWNELRQKITDAQMGRDEDGLTPGTVGWLNKYGPENCVYHGHLHARIPEHNCPQLPEPEEPYTGAMEEDQG